MARRQLQSMLLPIEADGSGIRAELQRIKTQTQADTLTISQSIDNLGKAAKRQEGAIKTLSREFIVLGGEATRGLGLAHGMAQNLLGAFAGGGALGLGIMAATQGIGLLTRHLGDARKEAEHFRAASEVFGLTRKEVDDLASAFQRAGLEIDGIATQRLAVLVREAGLSADEVARLGREAAQLATLNGTSIEQELTKRIRALGTEAERTDAVVRSITQAILALDGLKLDPTEASGLAELEAIDEEYRARLEQARRTLEEAQQAERWAGERYRRGSGSLADYRAAMDRRRAAEEHLAALEAEKRGRREAVAGALIDYAQRKEQAEAAEKAEREAAEARKRAAQAAAEAERRAAAERAQAARREAAELQAQIHLAEHRGEAEAAITLRLEQRLRTLEELRERGDISEHTAETEALIAVEQAEQQKRRLQEETYEQRQAWALEYQRMIAQIEGDQTTLLEMELDRQVEAVRRAVEQRVITEEEGHRQIERLREAQRQRDEAHEAQRVAKQEQEREAQVAAAAQQGTAVAGAFMQSMRRAVEEGDPRGMLRSILGLAAGALTFLGPMGAAAGFGLSTLAGFFADGGLIRGIGGPKEDRMLAAVSPGEYVQQASAVRKFGVRFMDRLNEGILDLSALPGLPGFASGGLVAAPPVAASPMPMGTVNNVYVSALSPSDAASAVAQYLEPAQHGRAVARADERLVLAQRRRILPRPTR